MKKAQPMHAVFFQILLLWVSQHNESSRYALAYQIRRKRRMISSVVSKREYKRLNDHEDAPPLNNDEGTATSFSNSFRLKGDGISKKKPTKTAITVTNIEQLQSLILDQNKELNQIEILNYAEEKSSSAFNHDVIQLMSKRFHENSKPGSRSDDAKLALAMEGGGMRGAVSAGMAAAVAALGLTDTIDTIYGSSAGSIIGAYMVSRQMCVDVYVDILPAAKKSFVCKNRLIKSIFSDLINVLASSVKKKTGPTSVDSIASTAPATSLPRTLAAAPGMNISFVLDGVMGEDHGVRPVDMVKFRENNEKQQLRVVSSCVDSKDNMFSVCFGTEHFFDDAAAERTDGKRNGLFACLEASVTVPGATGPPVELKNTGKGEGHPYLPCFDAFCFEPLPYRSAVEEGATHVLVLCSRPDGFLPKTTPGAYEKGVAPIYFRSHGHPQVAKFFENGGQQYIYAEDMLLLEQGKSSYTKVNVPPPRVLYGTSQTPATRHLIENRSTEWNSAHLLPVKVPSDTPEVATLEQDEDAILEGVRGGFAAAFDLLAPVVGLNNKINDGATITGEEAARLIFSDRSVEEARIALHTKVEAPGHLIDDPAVSIYPASDPSANSSRGGRLSMLTGWRRRHRGRTRRRTTTRRRWGLRRIMGRSSATGKSAESSLTALKASQLPAGRIVGKNDLRSDDEPHTLMMNLPGFRDGRFRHLGKDLWKKESVSR